MLGIVWGMILLCFEVANGSCYYYTSSNSIRCSGMTQSCSAATPTLGTGLALPKGIISSYIMNHVCNEYTN